MLTSLHFDNSVSLHVNSLLIDELKKFFLMILVGRNKIFPLIMNFLTFFAPSFHAPYTYVIKINYKTIYHNIKTIISHYIWFKSCGFINFVIDTI